MTQLLALIEASRAYGLRSAIVDALKAEYPEVQVKSWPGKLDVHEMVNKTNIAPPALLVAVTGQRPPDHLVSGVHDETVDVTVYVVTENKPLGVARKVYLGDEIGLALCNGLLLYLVTPAARWGIGDVGYPDEPKAQPVLTLSGLTEGTAYFAVTWRQTIYGQGQPLPGARELPAGPPPVVDPAFSPPGTDIEVGPIEVGP